MYSAKRVWQRSSLRSITLLTGLILCAGTIFFLIRMVPILHTEETVVVHYNIYLGIDQVRPTYWIFLLPLAWWSLTLIDLVIAYGIYHKDAQLSISLLALALAWSLPWALTLYYLTIVNL